MTSKRNSACSRNSQRDIHRYRPFVILFLLCCVVFFFGKQENPNKINLETKIKFKKTRKMLSIADTALCFYALVKGGFPIRVNPPNEPFRSASKAFVIEGDIKSFFGYLPPDLSIYLTEEYSVYSSIFPIKKCSLILSRTRICRSNISIM